MAATGTSIPNDADLQRTIPSVPRPNQINPSLEYSQTNIAHAADNAFYIPRSTNDKGATTGP
ncbi:hypothetical protein P154DRAFT_526804 [Amniculicola lignicola CBS 123094]|uniref:Uncharacterized protein n=1 Tax=Amniculicola lignicola CBS 123094 TaxID=1392246 RepID=A0A6A5WAZ9_9PLEO|nr:hypothetical protein P154DRAFT_526804 [Amniculicola lignicola CBS 123094]